MFEYFGKPGLFGNYNGYIASHSFQRADAKRFRNRRHTLHITEGEHQVHFITLKKAGKMKCAEMRNSATLRIDPVQHIPRACHDEPYILIFLQYFILQLPQNNQTFLESNPSEKSDHLFPLHAFRAVRGSLSYTGSTAL